jgi:restriction system protein
MSLWVVRAGRHGEQQETALNAGVVCHAWDQLPNYSSYKTKEELRRFYEKKYPEESPKQVISGFSQVWRFAHDIQKGDLVALPLKTESAIMIGEVVGDYEYKQIAPNVCHIRRVKWRKKFSRSAFDQDILSSMGSSLTIFQIERNEAEKRVRAMLLNGPKEKQSSHEPGPEVDLQQAATDELLLFIEHKFKGHELAWLVDGVLRAQGYKTEMSPPGPDGGVDILAGSGLLGFNDPRLCVQVKSSSSPADQKVFNELLGVMSKFKAQQGLFVSWGGYTKAVLQDSKKEYFSIRLWDQGDLVEAILANYERLDEEIRAELPLKRIWVLVRDEEG